MPDAFDASGPIYGDQAVLAPSAVRTASGSGTAYFMAQRNTMRLDLVVSAASGTTPSMTATVETSKDGSTNWSTVAAFTAATTVTSQRKVFTGFDRYARVSWAITGTTPSFTFSVQGEAV
jgi:hypothetical protein